MLSLNILKKKKTVFLKVLLNRGHEITHSHLTHVYIWECIFNPVFRTACPHWHWNCYTNQKKYGIISNYTGTGMSLMLCIPTNATTISFVCGLWLYIKKAENLSCFWRILPERIPQMCNTSTVHSQIIIKLLLIHDGKWCGTGKDQIKKVRLTQHITAFSTRRHCWPLFWVTKGTEE